jgi:hypothetical protein
MGELGFTFAIFFLYAKLFELGRYPVTVGGLFVPFFVLSTIVANRGKFRYLWYLAFICAYPVLVYLIHIGLGTVYAVTPDRFFLSYSLWVVSLTVIWCGFQPCSILRDVDPTKLLLVILFLGAVQFIGLQYFGKTFGFDIIQPISADNWFSKSHVNTLGASDVRAIGPYYEPSMFGRVVITLAMMLLVKDKKIGRFLIYSVVGFLLSKSFVIVVFAVAAFGLFVGLQKRRAILIISFVVLTTALAVPVLQQRLKTRTGGIADNSTMIRVVLPVYVLSKVLPDYPFGVPIGSNEAVVNATTWQFAFFKESKITSGFYEAILYFGFCILIPFAMIGWAVLQSARKSDLPMALAFIYLATATGASGSYLQIESSLLIAFFAIAMRRASTLEVWHPKECKVVAVLA